MNLLFLFFSSFAINFAFGGEPLDALDEAKVGMAAKFAAIPPAEFFMGSPETEVGHEADEKMHLVRLSRGFEMQVTEVTQLQFYLVTGKNPSYIVSEDLCDPGHFRIVMGVPLCEGHPVENLSWFEAREFIETLNQIQNEHTYRLPTEAEWEFAARGFGETIDFRCTAFYCPNLLDDYSWYFNPRDGRHGTHAVGQKMPTAFGLHDIYGNVTEWTEDYYGPYPETAVTDPRGPATGSHRVTRGADWITLVGNSHHESDPKAFVGFRPANRGYAPPSGWKTIGFRLVRTARK